MSRARLASALVTASCAVAHAVERSRAQKRAEVALGQIEIKQGEGNAERR